MEQTWKPIPGFEEYYEANIFGEIRSIRSGKLLKPRLANTGYMNIVLCACGAKKYLRRCRIIALTFLSNPFKKPQVNHKNGNHADDRLENLEWVTPKENAQHWVNEISHSYHHGHPQSKFAPKDIVNIKALRSAGKTLAEIAKCYDVSTHTICNVVNGITYRDRTTPAPPLKGTPRGEQHSCAKLKEEAVKKIKGILQRRGDGRIPSSRQIANDFGVCAATIRQIAQGRIWAHVSC